MSIDENLEAACTDCDNAVHGQIGSPYCKNCLLYGIYKATLKGFKVNENECKQTDNT